MCPGNKERPRRVALGPRRPGSRCPVGFQKGWARGRVGGPCLCWTAPALAGTQTSRAGSGCPQGCGAAWGRPSGPLGWGQNCRRSTGYWLCSPAFCSCPGLRHRQKVGCSLPHHPQKQPGPESRVASPQTYLWPGGALLPVQTPLPVGPCSL